jgi:hypothetical protein
MAKIHDDMPTDAVGASGSALGGRSTEKAPGLRPHRTRRSGLVYAAGVVVAIVACIAVVLIAVLPKGTVVLPPMSNSLGFWDRIPTPAAPTPATSNDVHSWDGIPSAASAHTGIQAHSEVSPNQEPAAAPAPSALETFRYTGQPAPEAPPPATHPGPETFRYTGEPALDVPPLATSTIHVSLGSIASER